MWHSSTVSGVLVAIGVMVVPAMVGRQDRAAAQKTAAPPLLKDYIAFSVTPPPRSIGSSGCSRRSMMSG